MTSIKLSDTNKYSEKIMSDKKQDDTLKQLEKMLADDVRDEADIKGFSISNKDLTGVVIRVSVSMVLILILYLTGILDRPLYVSFAILFIVSMEIFRYIKLKRQKSSTFQ